MIKLAYSHADTFINYVKINAVALSKKVINMFG